MNRHEFHIPQDIAEIAEAVVDAYLEQDANLKGLQTLIGYAILSYHNAPGGRYERNRAVMNRYQRERYARIKIEDSETLRVKERRRYERIMADPVQKAKKYARDAERHKLRRTTDVEAERERLRAKYHRTKARLGDAEFARLQRERTARRIARNPEGEKAKIRRATARSWARKNPEQMAALIDKAVPRSYPAHVRDDVKQMIATAMLRDGLHRSEVAAVSKQCMTAYWRERPEYRQSSMDAQRFDDGKATLHGTVTESLWSDG